MDTLHKKLQSRKQTVRANNCAQNCISSPPPSFLHTCYFPVSVFNALTVATQSPHSRSHTSVKELVSRKKQAERQRTGLFGLLWCRSFVLMWLPTFQRVQTKLITINSTRILPTILWRQYLEIFLILSRSKAWLSEKITLTRKIPTWGSRRKLKTEVG